MATMLANLLALDGVGDLLKSLPDPMRPYPEQILFVIVLIAVLTLILRFSFFAPVMQVVDDRERQLSAGSDTKAQAAALVASKQADYEARLKDLRGQAAAHRKSLAEAAAKEKQATLEAARTQATAQRQEALAKLTAQREAAKADLVAQVDQLAERMADQLLKQA